MEVSRQVLLLYILRCLGIGDVREFGLRREPGRSCFWGELLGAFGRAFLAKLYLRFC
jgi:hypothetical protein